MKAIIAGAGVSGLALALMLHRRGVEAVVYEQASEIREVGVGINILPHAIKELAALGLLPALDEAGIRTKELHYVSRLGQKVWSELRGTDAGFDFPQFSIHRGRLQKLIYDAVARRTRPRRGAHGHAAAGLSAERGRRRRAFHRRQIRARQRDRARRRADRRRRHPLGRAPAFLSARGTAELARLDAVARRRGMAEIPDRALDVYRRRHERQDRALPDRAGRDAAETRLTNWAIVSRIADGAITPPPSDSWSRVGAHGRGDPLCAPLHRARRRRRGAGARDAGLLGISDVRSRPACRTGVSAASR